MMRKMIVGFIAGVIMATSVSVYADEGLQKIEAYVRAGLPILLDGQKVTPESPPIMVDGSTYLKLRDVAKITGVGVNWNESTQTVELTSSNATVGSKSLAGSEIKVPTVENNIDPKERLTVIQIRLEMIHANLISLQRFSEFVKEGLKNNPDSQEHKDKLADYNNQIATLQAEQSNLEAEKAQLESQTGTP